MVASLMIAALLASPSPSFPAAGFRQPPAATPLPLNRDLVAVPPQRESHRLRNALIGGAIGGLAGIVTCTAISNLAKDPGTGFSTCTAQGYLLFGLGGFGLGAAIGALIK